MPVVKKSATKKTTAKKPPAKSASPSKKTPLAVCDINAAAGAKPSREVWELRLYVAGQTNKSLAAFANLKRICEEHLAGKYHIEIIDLLEFPQLARGDQILAIPTLVRKLPPPIKKIIGDLSNTERTLIGLDVIPRR